MSWNWEVFLIELLFGSFNSSSLATVVLMMATVVLAIATVVLVVVTTYYAITTTAILKEQRKSRTILQFDKKLEKLNLLKHDLRHEKQFWIIGENNHCHLNVEKIKFQFTYIFSKKLKHKLDLLTEKLISADNENKMMPWELDHIKKNIDKTLQTVENEIETCEKELNELVE